ncbi:MAG TPA: carbohydrate kinase family protein [Archaeoglobus profundus]|nr:carbohydrate kinase family protein [Archaeoglobus profundus]
MDVVGFGALNLDKIYKVNRIPGIEDEVYVKDVEVHPGGSAANTIVGLSRLGMKTGYIGKVGKDEDGKFLLEDLKREGVDIRNVIVEDGRTGNALILVDDNGNRAIIVDPGVNDTIRFDEIDLDFVSRFKVLHLTSFICKLSDESFKSQKKLVKMFEGYISFDPGIIYAQRGIDELRPILTYVDVLLLNKTEIEELTGLNYRDGVLELINIGVSVVVVKLGEDGCYITDGNIEITLPPFKVEVVDTTGAGDAFNAGFLYGFLKGKDLKECGKLGNLVASKCIQKFGARAGLPYSL